MSVIDTVKGALPEIKIPEIKLPEVKVPDLHLPEVHIPEVTKDDVTKPFYAVVGAYEKAYEVGKEQVYGALPKVKELQDTLPTLPAKLQEQLPGLPKTAQDKATEYQGKVTSYVAGLPAQLTSLREQATPATARAIEEKYAAKASSLYSELAGRGEKVVETVLALPQVQAVRAKLGSAAEAAPAPITEAPTDI